jgi:hypothetical protein
MGHIETDYLVIDSITGDVSRGGWEASAAFLNNQGLADYSRRVEAFWMPEGGGVWQDDYLSALRGFILPKSVTFDKGQSRTETTLATSHVFLENAGLQGIYFAVVNPPTNPHQALSWTLGDIVYHLVTAHTNVTDWVDVTGIERVDSSSINFFTVKESDSMWNTIKNIGSNEFYVPYFTKRDELIYAVHPMFASSLPEPVMELDYNYIIGQPTITYRDEVIPDQVQMYALDDDGSTYKTFYPENIGTEGRRHKETNLRCNSQARLNELAQRLYLFLQRQFQVQVTIAGPWGLLMELYDRIELTYTGTSRNGVSVQWTEKKFWISRISVRRVHNFGAVTELTLEEEDFEEGYFYSDYT